MLLIDKIRHIHLIGICGTGMASLAIMLKEKGFEVTGSDEGVYPPMSDLLVSKEIRVAQGYHHEHLRPEPDLVIVGNALSRGNPEIEYVLNFKLPYMSLPEAIKDFFLRGTSSVVITGTHGKTTTTSMIAWSLQSAGLDPSFFIGGVAENFQSSCKLGGGRYFVVEGDEYDSAFFDKGPKFLHYMPEIAVIGNVEYDHADIYPDLESIKVQFRRFVNLIPERGLLVVGCDSPSAIAVSEKAFCRKETFGLDPSFDWTARNIVPGKDRLCFDVLYKSKLFRRFSLGIIGNFNVKNCLAATAVLNHIGMPEDDICDAMDRFQGVRRRLQFLAEEDGIRIFEDFAHHPTAVRETLQAVRDSFRPTRLWAIYEPRSATSRRSIFQREIADALSLADCIALPELFKPEKVPAGERLDVSLLVADLRRLGREAWNLVNVEGIISKTCEESRAGDLIVILSNGGFGGIYEKLPGALKQRSAGHAKK